MTDDELFDTVGIDVTDIPQGSEEWHFVAMFCRATYRTGGEVEIFSADPVDCPNIDASCTTLPTRCWRTRNGNDYHESVTGFSEDGEFLGGVYEER